MQPTDAARAIRLAAIRRRDTDNQVDRRDLLNYDTSQGALDRRWLLGEVERLSTELIEMTRCRDAAIRQANRDDTNIEYDLDGRLRDAIAATNAEWDTADLSAPDWLIDAIVAEVRPELARLTVRLDNATDQLAALLADYERDVTT